MKIEHVAVWTQDLEGMRLFYEKYFGGKPGSKYQNPDKGFSSYFLSFESGARLEIMSRTDILDISNNREHKGIAHFAFSVGSEQEVDKLTDLLIKDGYKLIDGPRTTGDGYYESVILDPDGNRIEITI